MLQLTMELVLNRLERRAYRQRADVLAVIGNGHDDALVTVQLDENFECRPLDTQAQREAHARRRGIDYMGRDYAAAVLETLVQSAEQLEQPLSIADAADRLAMNAGPRSYLTYVVEGFDQLSITEDQARDLLMSVAMIGQTGHWPAASYEDEQQYLRRFGAAIRVLINPAWTTEVLARLVHLNLMNEETDARRLATR